MIHGNKTIFGYVNCAAYNRNASGDSHYWTTREARDAALKALREWAVDKGLSPSAARSGIYPVKCRAGALSADEREALDLNGTTRNG